MNKTLNPKGFKTYAKYQGLLLLEIQQKVNMIMNMFGYEYLYLPLVYKTENFNFSHNNLSEQMFSFLDKKNRQLTLIPELTKPTIDYYNERLYTHKNKKLFYFQPCFRYEKPQFCRKRQFFQWGIEIMNIHDQNLMIESIILNINIITLFIPLNRLVINLSMFPSNKKEIFDVLVKKIKQISLCVLCQQRWKQQNIWNILECKQCNSTLHIPSFSDCKQWLINIKKNIISYNEELKHHIFINDKIIRGINYYNGLMIEINFLDDNNREICLSGGGEYLNNQHVEHKNFGIATGIDRIMEIYEKYFVNSLNKQPQWIINLSITRYNIWDKQLEKLKLINWQNIMKYFKIHTTVQSQHNIRIEVDQFECRVLSKELNMNRHFLWLNHDLNVVFNYIFEHTINK